MSMYRLINKTGTDQAIDWLDGFVFPQDIEIDLLEPSSYDVGNGPVEYDFGIQPEEIIGIHNGIYFENIRTLLKTGDWLFSDGDRSLVLNEALKAIKYGQLTEIDSKFVINDYSGVSFDSHNLADMDKWPDGASGFEIVPDEGTVVHLTKAKVLLSRLFSAPDAVQFLVYMDYNHPTYGLINIAVKTITYETIDSLKLGADYIMTGAPVGEGISDRGSSETVHVIYKYSEPISLDSSLHMKLVVKFENDTPLDSKTLFMLRFEGKVEKIV